jgi:pimeloyl-ACP methyl ester carboxylesterase
MPSQPETQHLDMRGFSLPYRRAGSGPTVLFLHGAGGSSGWTPWHAALAEHVDLISPEHPGWDSTETPDWLDHTTDLAFFYLDVMDRLDLKNVHLVGHSLGGWTAAEIAIRNTSRLASLTLLCAVGLHVDGMQAADGFLLQPEERAKSLVYAQKHVDMMVQRAMDPDLLDLNLKNSQIAAKLLWQPRNYNPQLRKWLHRIDVPTLLLWGANDQVAPPAIADAYEALIPNTKKVLIDECGHIPPMEQTAAFLSNLTQFVQENAK